MRLCMHLLAALILALAGCASTEPRSTHLYDGVPRAEDQVARLSVDAATLTQPLFGFWQWVDLRSFDGKAIKDEAFSKREYIMLPGVHRLTVRYGYDPGGAAGLLEIFAGEVLRDRFTARFEAELVLDAGAGGDYALKFEVKRESALTPVTHWKVRYWIVDLKTGATVVSHDP